jgi:hypothetical protein
MAIASCLVDTNILLRISRRSDPQHKTIDAALAKLALAGTALHYTHQNIAELWGHRRENLRWVALSRPTHSQRTRMNGPPATASESPATSTRTRPKPQPFLKTLLHLKWCRTAFRRAGGAALLLPRRR